jgi:hypothetical protein
LGLDISPNRRSICSYLQFFMFAQRILMRLENVYLYIGLVLAFAPVDDMRLLANSGA